MSRQLLEEQALQLVLKLLLGLHFILITSTSGNANDAVFPVPVCDCSIMSASPLKNRGITSLWMSVGSEKPFLLIAPSVFLKALIFQNLLLIFLSPKSTPEEVQLVGGPGGI